MKILDISFKMTKRRLTLHYDKYFLDTFSSDSMLTDLFFLYEQYFEIQEKDFLTSSTNVKGRLTETFGFLENIPYLVLSLKL